MLLLKTCTLNIRHFNSNSYFSNNVNRLYIFFIQRAHQTLWYNNVPKYMYDQMLLYSNVPKYMYDQTLQYIYRNKIYLQTKQKKTQKFDLI